MQILKKIVFLLDSSSRKNFILLLFMMTVVALLEAIGVASILPFMTVLANPDIVETNLIFKKIYQILSIFGVNNYQKFIIVLGIFVLILLIISLFFKGITAYLQLKLVEKLQVGINTSLIKYFLGQSYTWFLNNHSSEIGKTILSEVGLVIGGGIKPLLELISKVLIVITILFLLLMIDVQTTLSIIFIIGTIYGLILYFIRKYLENIGSLRLKANSQRFKIVNEAFSAIKEIKLMGLENVYSNRFSISTHTFSKTQTLAGSVSLLPKFIIEMLTFGGIMVLILYKLGQENNFKTFVPIISLYVFAGYRLLPSIQSIYSSLSQLKFVGPSLDKINEYFNNIKFSEFNLKKTNIRFDKKISLNNICYTYPNSSKLILNNIDLEIDAGSSIGIIGKSGSGKTTIVDIILFLLKPQKGSLKVDGQIIDEKNAYSWQQMIGYVSQNINLIDDTISSNIALGLDHNDIDNDKVVESAKIAELHEFIDKELPNKYQTVIGERGVRLSGGQKQRIGIARALYLKPKLLVLDEATNALDRQTEKNIMNTINRIKNDFTTISIAHRINSIEKFDRIILIEKGKIIDNKV